jgi:hypothetical protein
MMEALRSSETRFLQEPHGVNIPVDGILLFSFQILHFILPDLLLFANPWTSTKF